MGRLEGQNNLVSGSQGPEQAISMACCLTMAQGLPGYVDANPVRILIFRLFMQDPPNPINAPTMDQCYETGYDVKK